jgi:hypothetical protein
MIKSYICGHVRARPHFSLELDSPGNGAPQAYPFHAPGLLLDSLYTQESGTIFSKNVPNIDNMITR